MPQQRPPPISRCLSRIIRDGGRARAPAAGLDQQLECVEARQAAYLEFYLCACALRLRCE